MKYVRTYYIPYMIHKRHEHTLHVHTLHTIMRHTYMVKAYVYANVSPYMCCISKERYDLLTLTLYEHQRG